MKENVAVVVTSIREPSPMLRDVAQGCQQSGYQLIVIGDEASPTEFDLDGCRFYSLKEQRELGLRFAQGCPTRHYARKNIGYLIAITNGADIIIDLDDDCIPYEGFWAPRSRNQSVPSISGSGWVNVYRYFSERNVWPRGLPLEHIGDSVPGFDDLPTVDTDCPIQQSLTDSDPDVDAIYRLTQPLPLTFRSDRRVALKSGSWSPFNSQNTAWWSDAFSLLYLPAYCRFRMTDIWRSFVAQRISWTNDWAVLFQEPTGRQERNEHDLMRDFEDELPGYLHNKKICEALGKLQLRSGIEHLSDNLRACYEQLVRIGMLDSRELDLVQAWIDDLNQTLA
jgi:hypothetical protein